MKKSISFFVYPLAVVLMSMVVIVGCSDDETEPVRPPTLTTLSVSDITENSAKSGGHISDDGGGEILLRGVVWSTELTPSLANYSGITFDGTGTGVFESIIAGLSAETSYYVRAFATNSEGASYGNEVMFETAFEEDGIIYGEGVTDIDGNEYVTVIIDNREWIAENLRVTRYNNGDDIPTDLSYDDWESTIEGAYAIYDHHNHDVVGINNPGEMVAAYGKLYNRFAVDDERGLCPEGWSVPSDAEWAGLVDYVVSQGYPDEWDNPNGVANTLKSCRQVKSPLGGDCTVSTAGHPRWDSHDTHHGFDVFGFSLLPGGFRWPQGNFAGIGRVGYWWASTEMCDIYVNNVHVVWEDAFVRIGVTQDKTEGESVRCIRDEDN